MNPSIWKETADMPEFPPLQSDRSTDVLIIGGGICGILCAYFLQQEGVDYLLVEKNRIGSGVTQNTTAKITSQHGMVYDKLIHSLGREKAALYLMANQKALEQYKKLAVNIECDFEEKPSGVYSLKDRAAVEREVKAIESLGFPAEFKEELPIPMDIAGAVLLPGQAQFHPMKFLSGLSGQLHILEQTFVEHIDGRRAQTNRGNITAKKMIVATHFPFLNRRGAYFLKLYQRRSYVIALTQAADVKGMYIDAAQDGLSFRNYKEMLLLGGGGHRTGKQGGNWQELRAFAKTAYPGAKETARWATQDCMSLDGIPYIGQYSKRTPELFVASGFQKWGMTSSMAAAMLLTDLVLERENPWRELFSPSRSILKPQLFLNGLESMGNMLFPSLNRCPHLGCALHWNAQERTWDCACHGSRFESDGTLIDNPAQKNAGGLSAKS